MSDPRMTGLALMAISTAAFVGTTSNSLPPITFFPALVLFVTGAIQFVRTNHIALEKGEKRVHHRVNPVIREDKHVGAHAERQAARRGAVLNQSTAENNNANAVASQSTSRREFIEVDQPGSEFVVETDVSFPAEIQSGNALADQLGKLNQLLEQGVLTAEEYAVAKTKLLS
jgi:hypothetical protein